MATSYLPPAGIPSTAIVANFTLPTMATTASSLIVMAPPLPLPQTTIGTQNQTSYST